MPRLPEFDEIAFLVHRKYPLYGKLSRLHFGDTSGLPLEERNRLLDEIEAYEKELHTLSQRALEERVEKEKKKQEEAEEAGRPFNRPEAAADYEQSASLGWWSAEEAIALFLGKDPEYVTWKVVEPFVEVSPFARAFAQLMKRILRAPKVEQLSHRATPQEWGEWATLYSVAVPQELMAAMKARGKATSDLQSLRDAAERLTQEVAELKAALANEREELERVRREVAEHPPGKRERDTLLTLALVGAMKGYKHHPRKRGDAATRISNDLHLLGLPRSADCVRTHLTEAAELLENDWSENWKY